VAVVSKFILWRIQLRLLSVNIKIRVLVLCCVFKLTVISHPSGHLVTYKYGLAITTTVELADKRASVCPVKGQLLMIRTCAVWSCGQQ